MANSKGKRNGSAGGAAVLDKDQVNDKNERSAERDCIFDAFRHWGYLEADLDPLGFLKPEPHPDLQMTGDAAQQARGFYCGTVGVEFMHIADPERRRWIQEHMEGVQPETNQKAALDLLIRSDLFEQVLQQRYLGTKRFSLRGCHRSHSPHGRSS